MKMRKWIATLVAATLLLTLTGSALAETVPGAVYGPIPPRPTLVVQQQLNGLGIKDVKPDNWAASSITVLVGGGLLTPNASGQVKPDQAASVNQTTAIFAKVLGIASKTDDDATAAQKAEQAGLLSNRPAVDRDMTRVEVARLLGKALGVQPKIIGSQGEYPFNDFNSTSEEDRGLLAALYDLGIFKGFEDKTFRPDSVLTTAQIAVLVDRILGASGQ